MAAMLVVGNNIAIVFTKLNLSKKKTIKNKLIETKAFFGAKRHEQWCANRRYFSRFASLQSREKRKRKKNCACSKG